jgi:ribosome biogenesis GTPase A
VFTLLLFSKHYGNYLNKKKTKSILTSSIMQKDTQLVGLRKEIYDYKPGIKNYDITIQKKAPKKVVIGVIGAKGHGKSALINSIKSSQEDCEPFPFAATTSKGNFFLYIFTQFE